MTGQAQPSRATARGTVKTGIAHAVMMVCGLIIHVYLARALEPELYGVLAVVTSVIVWWQVVGHSLLGTGLVRFVAEARGKWQGVAGTGVRVQALWSVLVALACAATSPLIARLLGHADITVYLWLFTADLLLFGCYEAFRCVLIGRRKYGHNATVMAWYWLAKALLVCGLVALGLSVKGAIIGSMAASLVGLAVAWYWSGVGLPRAGFPARTLIMFGLPLMGIVVVTRLVENMDLWCVAALLEDPRAPGYYGAAKYMYQAAVMLPMAVVGAMFPTITQAISGKNEESRRELIEQSFRFAFVTMLLVIALVGCCAKDVVVLVFSAPYAAAATPAFVLMVAALMFCLRTIGSASLVAAGKPGVPLAALAPLLPANIALNLVLIPRYELLGGALATAVTGLVAALVMLALVWREFHVLFSAVSLLRCVAAAAMVYLLGIVVPGESWLVLAKLLGLSGMYLLVLILSGELTRRDFEPLIFWGG